MSNIYHGCFRKNTDGTNRIIANNEKCLLPTSRAFWKYIEDIPTGAKTQVSIRVKSSLIVELSILIFKEKTKILCDRKQHPIQKFVF